MIRFLTKYEPFIYTDLTYYEDMVESKKRLSYPQIILIRFKGGKWHRMQDLLVRICIFLFRAMGIR